MPAERVRRLRRDEGLFNEAAGTMDMHTGQQPSRGAGEDHQLHPQRAHEIQNRLSAITGIPIPAQAASFTIDRDGDAIELSPEPSWDRVAYVPR